MMLKKDICDLCGEECVEAYWLEVMCKNGEAQDYFVCLNCFNQNIQSKKSSKNPNY